MDENKSHHDLKRADYLIAFLAFVLIIFQGVFSIHKVGISWDEPYYFAMAKQYVDWAGMIGTDEWFAPATLERIFGLEPLLKYHPTLSKLFGAISFAILKDRMGGFWAYRVSAPVLFGLLIALVYLRSSKAWGRTAGMASALCVTFIPRFFVHNHIAGTDAPLCLFWFLGVWAFDAASERRSLAPLAGIAFGLVMSIKFTGFLLPIPLLVWGLIYARRNMMLPLLCVIFIGPIVFILLEPGIWDHPLSNSIEFVRMSMARAGWNPRWMLFLGNIYNFSPPWFYAPFMIMITVPEIILGLFFIGAVRFMRDKLKDKFLGACMIHFLFFQAITFSPNAPVFDGVRLFLPAFVFLGIIAGYGFDQVIGWVKDKAGADRSTSGSGRSRAIPAALAAAIFLGTVSPFMGIYPYGLEYYNGFIGGVKGARKRGMETTYWWTVVNKDTLSRVNQIVPPGATLRFSPMDTGMWKLYRELGLIRDDIKITNGSDFDYVLILSRPYWNYDRIFRYIGVPPVQLKPLASHIEDEVPFWILYKRK